MLNDVVQGGVHLRSGVRICWTAQVGGDAAADDHVSAMKLWPLTVSTRTSGTM
jgi:hypothetical protein